MYPYLYVFWFMRRCRRQTLLQLLFVIEIEVIQTGVRVVVNLTELGHPFSDSLNISLPLSMKLCCIHFRISK